MTDGRIGMVKGLRRSLLIIKAVRELGLQKLFLFAVYRLGMLSGYYRWRSRERTGDHKTKSAEEYASSGGLYKKVFPLPDPKVVKDVIGSAGVEQLIKEADEIVSGNVRLFGGELVPLNLTVPGSIKHWTKHLGGQEIVDSVSGSKDIKFIWEPARFGWTYTLGRAYHLTGNEAYPGAFWDYFELFQKNNPVNMGPNWVSGQECALRILAFTFAAEVFDGALCSTRERKLKLADAVADHANRIPVTMVYARSLNNNHLLSEAAGLITASLVLYDHIKSKGWGEMGWWWFNRGLETQITSDGVYNQHSTNYHRLMLQLVLWVCHLSHGNEITDKSAGTERLSAGGLRKVQQAVRWLQRLCDPDTGKVPNLGSNDGAYILPLTVNTFYDYRPVLQAASKSLLGQPYYQPGSWDEMFLWLQSEPPKTGLMDGEIDYPLSLQIIRKNHSWAYLRTAKFTDRPNHCDQLHLDLWWHGLNVARDAGTYLYNGEPPWENSLTHTSVHNTVMLNNQEQMSRVSKFLYVGWAQASVEKREGAPDATWEKITAQHNGYERIGAIHKRSVTAFQDRRWVVEDLITQSKMEIPGFEHSIRAHWLLPDWEYDISKDELGIKIHSPYGWIILNLEATDHTGVRISEGQLSLVRSGVLLAGSGDPQPYWGWYSPTYGVKQPALSFSIEIRRGLPVHIRSEWIFPDYRNNNS